MTFTRTEPPKSLPPSGPMATTLRLRSSTSLTASAVDAGFDAISADGRGVDILVNNAGIAEGSSTKLFKRVGPRRLASDNRSECVRDHEYGSEKPAGDDRARLGTDHPDFVRGRFGRTAIGVSSYGASKAAAESLIARRG